MDIISQNTAGLSRAPLGTLQQEFLQNWVIALVCNQRHLLCASGHGRRTRAGIWSWEIIGKRKLTSFSRNPTLYLKGINIIIVLFQDEFLATDPDNLLDGKHHRYQFFYKHPYFLEFPQNISNLIEKVETPNNK